MTEETLLQRFRQLCSGPVPLPGSGDTPTRHRRLYEIGHEDLTLAKLVEAHWDAVAILAEAGRPPVAGQIYGVWASEAPGNPLELREDGTSGYRLYGRKSFASGASLVDRALVTVNTPASLLVEVDMRAHPDTVAMDESGWNTDAFRMTHTAAITFSGTPIEGQPIGTAGWYEGRAGLWNGGLGPAACWAGGAAGLLDFALESRRDDPHTLAHLGAIHAQVWSMRNLLTIAGQEIDDSPLGRDTAKMRSLTVRALMEQGCAEVLTRIGRAFGPYPLAIHEEMARRTRELELFIRQCHAERDLEVLGRLLRNR